MKLTTMELLLSPFPLAVVIVLATIGLVIVYRLWLHPLASFPGPKKWAITRLPWVASTVKGRIWRDMVLLHEKYGTTVRIAPGELSINSPGAWTDIYNCRPLPLLPKEPASQTPPLNGAHSLFTAVGDGHRRLRGILTAGFSDKALREQAPLIENHGVELMERLRRELNVASTPVLDIEKYFGYFAMDTMVDLGFGSSMDGLAGHNEHDWIARFFLHGRFSTIRMCTCWFSPLDKILDTLFLALKRRQRAKNWALFSSKIEARLAKGDLGSERSDLVTPVFGKLTDKIEAGNNGNTKEKRITKGELLSHALACTLANSQLTTGGITTCTYLLLQNQKVMQELVSEIRGTFTSEDQIGVTSTQSLVYLEAVLNETLRIHNPTPINLPRVIPPEGRVIEGTFIPGNTIVGINLHVIQTSPLYWFEPHVFHPERFLPQTDPRYDHRFDQDVKAAFMPFSTGPRNCIGAKLYFAQARVALVKLLFNFDIKVANTEMEGWLDQEAYIACEPKPLRVKLIDQQR